MPVTAGGGGDGNSSRDFTKNNLINFLRKQGIRYLHTEASYGDFCGMGKKGLETYSRIDVFISPGATARDLLCPQSFMHQALSPFIVKNPVTAKTSAQIKASLTYRLLQYYAKEPGKVSQIEELLFSALENPKEIMVSFYFNKAGNLTEFRFPIAEWMFSEFLAYAGAAGNQQDYRVLFAAPHYVIDTNAYIDGTTPAGHKLVSYRLAAMVPKEGKIIALTYWEKDHPHLVCCTWEYKDQNWSRQAVGRRRREAGAMKNLHGNKVAEFINTPLPVLGVVTEEAELLLLPIGVREKLVKTNAKLKTELIEWEEDLLLIQLGRRFFGELQKQGVLEEAVLNP